MDINLSRKPWLGLNAEVRILKGWAFQMPNSEFLDNNWLIFCEASVILVELTYQSNQVWVN